MKCKTVLFAMVLAAPVLCLADAPAPFARQCALLDKVFETAKSQPSRSRAALDVFERVAEGRAERIPADSEFQLGLKPGELQQAEFKDATVRAHAMRKIGDTDLPEALEYLKSLKSDSLPPDDTEQVWPASHVALHQALLNRILDLQSKTEFLENTLKNWGAVGTWAVDQLCDRGILTSLPVIQESIRRRLTGQDVEDEIQFCEQRIRAMSRDPDRVISLGVLLSIDAGTENRRLTLWAVNQLASMYSPRADAELDRFAAEIGKLAEGSPQKQELFVFSQTIRKLSAQRSQ